VDLFGQSLMDDLVYATASTSSAVPNVGAASLAEVDLFANTDFQSANAPLETTAGSHTQVYHVLMSSDIFFLSVQKKVISF
jgi:epsin